MKRASQRGFTLLELLVVVAILAMLAGAVIPMVTNSTERTQASVAAANVTDLTKTIDSFWTYNGYYPDGWDTLIGASDTAGTTATGSLFTKLMTRLQSTSSPVVQLVNASVADPSAALWRARMQNYYNHVEGYASITSMLPNDATSLPTSTPVAPYSSIGVPSSSVQLAVLNYTVSLTDPIYSVLVNDWNLLGVSSTYLTDHNFIVLGLGNRNTLVGREMRSAPSLDLDSAALYYTRPLAVFAVPSASTSTEKAKLVGMLGPDGRSLNQYLRNFHSPAP